MRMVAYAFAGVEPETMGTGPIPATEKALAKAGLTIADIGLIEINEAFAVQVLAFTDHFQLADDDERINRYGGAIPMGHPLASSGVRLMTQLARQFAERPDVRYGLTTMCVGLGMGGTVIWENPHFGSESEHDQAAGGLIVLGFAAEVRVLPDHRAAHAEPDAHRGQPVPDVGSLGELPGKLRHQADTGRGQRMPHGDRATVPVDPLVVVGQLEMIGEREHLHGESLVDLDQADVLSLIHISEPTRRTPIS